jgi:phosphoribosyl 1,2-cyclic phosphodiesterase
MENRQRFGAKRIVLTHLSREMLGHVEELELEVAEDGLLLEV